LSPEDRAPVMDVGEYWLFPREFLNWQRNYALMKKVMTFRLKIFVQFENLGVNCSVDLGPAFFLSTAVIF
jgi:hypothetical protein